MLLSRANPDDATETAAAPDSPGRDSASGRIAAGIDWALIGLGLLGAWLLLPHYVIADGAQRLADLDRLLAHGVLRAEYPKYSIVGPLFSAPLYWLGGIVMDPAWWCARYNALLLSVGVLGLAALLRRHLAPGPLRQFLLLLVAASMFPNAARQYGAETFSALAVLAGIFALAVGRDALAAAALVLGTANTPPLLVGLGAVSAVHALSRRRLRYLLLPVAALGLYLVESRLRRGGVLVTGYEGDAGFRTLLPYSGLPGFSYPLLFGLLSILLSFGKGLVFFTPGVFLALRPGREDLGAEMRTAYRLCVWFVGGLLLVYAPWWSWYGGFVWGPRFFLFASAVSCFVLAARLQGCRTSLPARLVTLLGLGLSGWVGISGAVFDLDGLSICAARQYAMELLCWYTPEFSPLWHPFVAPRTLAAAEWLYVGYVALALCWVGRQSLLVACRQVRDGARDWLRDRTDGGVWGV